MLTADSDSNSNFGCVGSEPNAEQVKLEHRVRERERERVKRREPTAASRTLSFESRERSVWRWSCYCLAVGCCQCACNSRSPSPPPSSSSRSADADQFRVCFAAVKPHALKDDDEALSLVYFLWFFVYRFYLYFLLFIIIFLPSSSSSHTHTHTGMHTHTNNVGYRATLCATLLRFTLSEILAFICASARTLYSLKANMYNINFKSKHFINQQLCCCPILF